jgi:PhoH-like ATPase
VGLAPVREHKQTFVLDTSVLLSDPKAPLRFDEHDVVLPLVVIAELEAKRTHPELGFFAREALRLLDDLRVEKGGLDKPIPLGDFGGTLRVDLSQVSAESLPAAFGPLDNDGRILATAQQLSQNGCDVVVVSKDLPMRVKASALGLAAEEYLAEFVKISGWTGISELDLTTSELDELVFQSNN